MTTQEMGNSIVSNMDVMLRYARSIDAKNAEDFVQEASVKALEMSESFKGGDVLHWLNRIVRNVATDYYKHEEARERYMETIEEPVCFLDYNVDIENCLKALNIKQREAVSLLMKGYNHREISECLNVPIGTIQTRIHYGCKKIKSII